MLGFFSAKSTGFQQRLACNGVNLRCNDAYLACNDPYLAYNEAYLAYNRRQVACFYPEPASNGQNMAGNESLLAILPHFLEGIVISFKLSGNP
jgi:hypothetical protein